MEEGFDYVAPYYLPHQYGGTITNSLASPHTQPLPGQRNRPPHPRPTQRAGMIRSACP